MVTQIKNKLEKVIIGVAIILIAGSISGFIAIKSGHAVHTEQIDTNATNIAIIQDDMKSVATKDDVKESREIVMDFIQALIDKE